MGHKALAGVHFTGSTAVFQDMWRTVGRNIKRYGCYPRIVGETGGKDFVFAHPSADVEALVVALVRGAFEYQGQKCSAASRAYIPRALGRRQDASCWPDPLDRDGRPGDFTNFMGAVIDKRPPSTIKGYIDRAKKARPAEIVAGGECDDSVGYFIEPTVIECRRPGLRVAWWRRSSARADVFVYEDKDLVKTLEAVRRRASAYALTGAIFAQDRRSRSGRWTTRCGTAGNFYINDKPTGAVVGQQPFGGGRASGTNDKAGSAPEPDALDLQPADDQGDVREGRPRGRPPQRTTATRTLDGQVLQVTETAVASGWADCICPYFAAAGLALAPGEYTLDYRYAETLAGEEPQHWWRCELPFVVGEGIDAAKDGLIVALHTEGCGITTTAVPDPGAPRHEHPTWTAVKAIFR
jgi:hypothetical protein